VFQAPVAEELSPHRAAERNAAVGAASAVRSDTDNPVQHAHTASAGMAVNRA
jgi:hypothetical protein